MKFFHFAPMTLGPGSVIEPGNWGRIITHSQIAIQGSDGSLIAGYVGRELMFEVVRLQDFPTKPCRFKAIFGCPTIEDAQAYIGADKRQVLHEVETVDEQATTHIGAISFCDITIGAPFIETTGHRATRYWDGTPGDPARGNEIIVESGVRVIRVV